MLCEEMVTWPVVGFRKQVRAGVGAWDHERHTRLAAGEAKTIGHVQTGDVGEVDLNGFDWERRG